MKIKRIAQYCCAALVAAGIGLNIQNAIENYGIGENSLSLVATGGSGSSSSSTTTTPLKYSCAKETAGYDEDWFTTSFKATIMAGYLYVGVKGDGWYYHKKKRVRYLYRRWCEAKEGAVLTLAQCKSSCKSDTGVSSTSN